MVNLNVHLSRDTIAAVVDIAEGRASVCVLSFSKGKPCTVLAYGHSTISLESRTPEQEIASIGQHISEAGQAAMKMYAAEGHHAPVGSVYAIMHAPWVRSEEVTTSAAYDTDTKIHDSTIGQLAQGALQNIKEVDRSKFFEACVIRIELNGYPCLEPAGKIARTLQVTSLISDCDPDARAAAQSAIASTFPVAQIVWRTSLRAILMLMRHAHDAPEFVVADMHMSTTHFVSVREGGLAQRSVPEGIRTILMRIAPGKPPEDTLSNMRLLARDACSTDACEAVQKALVLAEPDLVRVFGDALGKMAQYERLPNDFVLLTHADMEQWFTQSFARIDFSQFTVTTLPLAVHAPAELDVSAYVSKDLSDAALAIGAALVNIELSE